MSNKPRFSVVIPTRNRAKLLPFAMQSVLNQSFNDCELIISDNFSIDETSEVAHAFNDKRVKYFRSERSLSMNESYEFATSHAKGEYVTFLSDDDAFTITAFERAAKIIDETKTKLLNWKYAHYYLNDFFQSVDYPPFHPLRRIKSNTVLIPTFSNQLFEINPEATINRLLLNETAESFSFINPSPGVASLTNAVYHYLIFEEIKNKGLNLFPKYVIPDMYAFVLTLSAVKEYFYLDTPLTVFCRSNLSTTQSTVDKGACHRTFSDGKSEPFINYAPLKNLINENYWIESFLQGLNDAGERFQHLQFNRNNYFLTIFDQLLYYKKHGIDVSQELEEFYSVLSEESEELNSAIRAKTAKSASQKFTQMIRELPRPSFMTERIARSKPELLQNRNIIIQGNNEYFRNIYESATWLDTKNLDDIARFCAAAYEGEKRDLPFKYQIV